MRVPPRKRTCAFLPMMSGLTALDIGSSPICEYQPHTALDAVSSVLPRCHDPAWERERIIVPLYFRIGDLRTASPCSVASRGYYSEVFWVDIGTHGGRVVDVG